MDKMWVHNRQPYTGMPYILADSTTGSWNLKGLIWNVDISRELVRDHLYGGLSVFYNVDESVKDIFPRPMSRHRDMSFAGSLGWAAAGNLRVGMTLEYYNLQESMHTWPYRLDQEKTPIFFKPRGLDTPLIFHGQTSEERLYFIEGLLYSVDGQLQDFWFDEINISGNYGGSFAENVDGGAYPIDQGSWEDRYASFSADLLLSLNMWLNFRLFGNGWFREQTATHPDFALHIYSETERELRGGGSLAVGSARNIRLIPAATVVSRMLKREDSFNGILDYFPGTMVQVQLGIEFPRMPMGAYSCSFGSDVYTTRDNEIYKPNNTTFYYDLITAPDELFFDTDYRCFRFSQLLSLGEKRRFSLLLDYLRIMPENSDNFGDAIREQINLKFVLDIHPEDI